MKTSIIITLLFLLSVSINAQYNNKNLTLASNESAVKFTYGNMRIYPIYANEVFEKINKNSDNFITLKDALEKKKIKISENNANDENAEVNNLTIQNLSNDSIMILGGEVIEGGKQDRMIADDVIIPPHSSKIKLNVYCVEHGRWTTKGTGSASYNFSPSDATPMASPEIRKAGSVQKSQSTVWEKVEDVSIKRNVKSNTGAYTALKSDTNLQKNTSAYRAFFSTILKSDPKIIGALYATSNRIIGCDLFATHSLLMKHSSNLINSYATEAMTNGSKVKIEYKTVEKYINDLLADDKTQELKIKSNGNQLKNNGSKLHIATY